MGIIFVVVAVTVIVVAVTVVAVIVVAVIVVAVFVVVKRYGIVVGINIVHSVTVVVACIQGLAQHNA